MINKSKAVLFGGATKDTGSFAMTSQTFVFNMSHKRWTELIPNGATPAPRAAHAAASIEQLQVAIYGGATGGGRVATDGLHLLDLRHGERQAEWMTVPVVGATPGRRYGHSMGYSKPYLLVFGGSAEKEPLNDVWCLDVKKSPFSWVKLDCGGASPPARVYHSAALCHTGSAAGMMVCFGGRAAD